MGNCGVGFAPVDPDRHDWLIAMMEGVEDIPGTALHEGLQWDWESFPEYLDALERQPRTIDVGTHVPHAALRAFVMGERGADPSEHPDEDELDTMASLLRPGPRRRRPRGDDVTDRAPPHQHRREPRHPAGPGTGVDGPGLHAPLHRRWASSSSSPTATAPPTTSSPRPSSHWSNEFARVSRRPVSYTVQQDIEAPERWRDLMALAAWLRVRGIRRQGPGGPPPDRRAARARGVGQRLHPGPGLRRVSPGCRWPSGWRPCSDPERRQQILEGHAALTIGPDAFAGIRLLRAVRRHVRPRGSGGLQPRRVPVARRHGPTDRGRPRELRL